jgi:predicted esterase
MRMPAWFDIKSLSDVMAHQDEDGMLKSIHLVHKLITEEVDAGIPSNKIIVGGFSQGNAFRDSYLISRMCNRHTRWIFM